MGAEDGGSFGANSLLATPTPPTNKAQPDRQAYDPIRAGGRTPQQRKSLLTDHHTVLAAGDLFVGEPGTRRQVTVLQRLSRVSWKLRLRSPA
jgi:hypothetical protein